MPRISIVVPVYNERANLDPLLEELRAALAATGASYEIVLVDDGSADGSAEWIVDEGRRDERVVPVLLKRNRGQSTALAVGLMRARGEILVTLDADLQNDPADLPRVLEALGEADVVSGVRADRQDGWLRLVSSRVANVARRAWLGDPITDRKIRHTGKATAHPDAGSLALFAVVVAEAPESACRRVRVDGLQIGGHHRAVRKHTHPLRPKEHFRRPRLEWVGSLAQDMAQHHLRELVHE